MNLSTPVSFRVTKDELAAIVAAATDAGMSISEYTRKLHREALQCAPVERSLLRRQIIDGELTREYIVRAQDGENLADVAVRSEIERSVLGRVDALLERHLFVTKRMTKVDTNR
jgi:hypothetical protein